MYGCESWTTKKTECQRFDAFELWCCRRLLRVPWTCKEIQAVHPKGDQSWIFIGRADAEAEKPILWSPDVKNRLIWRLWCWERLKAGGEGEDRGWDVGWHHWLSGVWVSSGSWWWTAKPGVPLSMRSWRDRHDWATELNCIQLSLTPCLSCWISPTRSWNVGTEQSYTVLAAFVSGPTNSPWGPQTWKIFPIGSGICFVPSSHPTSFFLHTCKRGNSQKPLLSFLLFT